MSYIDKTYLINKNYNEIKSDIAKLKRDYYKVIIEDLENNRDITDGKNETNQIQSVIKEKMLDLDIYYVKAVDAIIREVKKEASRKDAEEQKRIEEEKKKQNEKLKGDDNGV